jgi:hypothetical protein
MTNYLNKPIKVLNVPKRCHDGPVRMGDLTFMLYRLEYERRKCSTHYLKFHLPDENIYIDEYWGTVKADHRLHYKWWLEQRTDYFSNTLGKEDCSVQLSWWGMLPTLKDLVKINNPEPMKKKIAVFPLIDAKYNQERNWPRRVLDDILRAYSQYEDYERVICCANKIESIDPYNFTFSTDFHANLQHLLECKIFVGGDTGFTILAGALDKPERKLQYYYAEGYHGGWTSDNSLPLTSQGTPIYYKRLATDIWDY